MKFSAGKLDDFDENSPTTVRIAPNFQIVLIRKGSSVFALNDECPHMGGPLGEGEVEGNMIVCPWHFWRFNIETGACSEEDEPGARCYQTAVENGEVFIEIPEHQK